MEQLEQDESAPKSKRRGRPRTRGATTQMIVRVDRKLKIRGDEVLRAAGTNPTDIVSRLWSYVARTESVPEFLIDEEIQKHDEELRRLRTAIAEARGMVWKTLVDEGVFLEDAAPRLNADEIQLVKQYW